MLAKFDVQILRAIDRYDVAHTFSMKHLNVLKEHKVEGITSMKPEWKYKPNVYIISVNDIKTNEMIGGMRLEVASELHLLPFEAALSNKVTEVHNFVGFHRQDGGACEFSGLWIDSNYKKLEIPTLLTNLGISLSNKLGIRYAFAFANNYSRPITEKLKFVPQSIMEQSVFMYPDERYPTQLMRKDCIYDDNSYATIDNSLKVFQKLE